MSCMKQVVEVIDLLDDPRIDGERVKTFLSKSGVESIQVIPATSQKRRTDFIKIIVSGRKGKARAGHAPTLGISGQLGGVGARPELIGIVSDADGAIVALASALKLGVAQSRGDFTDGDVIIMTHISPSAPIIPHKPVPFMGSPVGDEDLLKHSVDPQMDAVLSVDCTKGNRVIKTAGFSITPTVKDGWILKISDDLIDMYERVTGANLVAVPITMQDITPYGNEVYHINGMMQPWLATKAPLVGVATTAGLPVPGCGTGANYIVGLESATRFCVEVARSFTSGNCEFYDEQEFQTLTSLYGEMGSRLRKS